MIKIAIIGASGYTGGELLRLLRHHPNMEVTVITSRQNSGKSVLEVFPHLRGAYKDLTFEEPNYADIKGRVDGAFTALPHGASVEAVSKLAIGISTKDTSGETSGDTSKDTSKTNILPVVDLSADFRFNNIATYEATYSPHTKPGLLEKAVYGLPEMYRDKIKDANIVGNPGCYPTGAILGLYPLLKKDLIKTGGIIIDSKSGVTGAGRVPSPANLFPEISEGLHAYKVGNHRHTPEIEENLTTAASKKITITFTPHLIPINRGILTTIYTEIKEEASLDEVLNTFSSIYADEPFVRILPSGVIPNTAWVRGSNFIDIGAVVVEKTKRLVIVTAIDNLVKGAAGQAIQNMNLILGLPEETGLTDLPLFP
jgi:N-acetyl-gamma-glutamyl-phosphate reductase